MSLSNFAATNVANFVYTGTSEVGVIVENFSKGVATTNEDFGYNPVTGKVELYGNHTDEVVRGSISTITLSGGLMGAVVGNSYSLSTSVAVAGHSNSNRTTVITGIELDKDNAGGKFQRGTFEYISLPF